MMGRDVERILLNVSNIKDILGEMIGSLSNTITDRIEVEYEGGDVNVSKGDYVSDVSYNPISEVQEIENIVESDPYLSGVNSIIEKLIVDVDKMKSLSGRLYTSTSSFNNSYGSPWKELSELYKAVENVKTFCENNPQMKFIGQKVALMTLMNTAISHSIDAKWAIVQYHDYIQRGFDYKYNERNPSITTKRTASRTSIGNLNQSYSENVNIKEKPLDPF